jgi:hypothetical protein
MSKRAGVGIVIAALAIVGWWWRRPAPVATPSAVVTPTVRPGPGAVTPTPAGGARARIHGAIRDARGPVADATVRLAPADAGELIAVRTDAGGSFHAVDLAPGAWMVSASAPGHAPRAHAVTVVADQDATLDLVLDDGGRALSGLVTDASGGPVAGARVDAAKLGATAQPSDDVASTVTGRDGRYQLTVAEGQLLVAVADPDYAPIARVVDVGPAGATADFALIPGGVLEGVVRRDGDRAPVAGARVEAHRDGPSIELAESGRPRFTIADRDGRFRLAGLPPGAYDLDARSGELSSRGPTSIGLGVADQRTDLELVIGAGPVIRGVVVDEAGAPVADAGIIVVTRDQDDATHSDAQGRFAVVGVPPGRHGLVASHAGHLASTMVAVEVAADDVTGVRLVLRHGAALRGHVEPRQVATVRLELRRTEALGVQLPPLTTEASGDFDFPVLASGPGKLSGRGPSGDQGELEVTIADGAPEVVLHLTPGGAIAGRVVDGDGHPVAGVTVAATALGDGDRTTIVDGRVTSGVQGLTSSTGSYELRGLVAGPYRLAVLDRGRPLPLHGAAARARLTLAAAEHRTGVDLAIERATGVIRGVVQDASGKPIADAWVSVHQGFEELVGMHGPPDDGPPGEASAPGEPKTVSFEVTSAGGDGGVFPPALTDAQGHFELRGLPRGRYQVAAEAQAGKLRGFAEGVSPDATITITAQALTELVGAVTSAAGPVPLFTVELEGPTHATQTFADPTGAFRFGRVDPGRYTVRVHGSAGNGEATVEVVSGHRAEVAITVVANGVVIGTLVEATGAPAAHVGVALVPDHGDGNIQLMLAGPPPETAADGRFRVEGSAGKQIFVALLGGGLFSKPGLVIEAGKTIDLGVVTLDPPRKPGRPGKPTAP